MLGELQLLSSTIGAYVFVVLLGLLWGSFANVCIYRWPPTDEFPDGRSVVTPGSHCFVCKTPIKWYDNVPIFAWLWLRGRCRTCKTAFSGRYLIVEALTGLLFGVAWHLAITLQPMRESFGVALGRFAIDATFCWTVVVITFIDIDHRLILDKMTFPGIALFYAASLLLPERQWYDGLIGAAVGFGLPFLVATLYQLIRKREGIGMGDWKLLAMFGALLGWKGAIVSLFGGAMIGSVFGVVHLLTRKQSENDEDDEEGQGLNTELPFGPYLCAAALVYLFGEPWIQLRFAL